MSATRIIGVVAMITVAVVGTKRWRGAESPSDWRARFTQAALQIPFGKDLPPERDSLVRSDAKIPEAFLKLRIAAARTRDTSRAGGIGFRITSDTAYPRLGIAQGVNYVWEDVARGKTRFLMIPADPAKPAYWLAVSSHVHPATTATARLILVMHAMKMKTKGQPSVQALDAEACAECKDDPMSWCSARDTVTRIEDFKLVPLSEITRYFARNHVAFALR